MALIVLKCDYDGYEKEYEVQTYEDEWGIKQPDMSGITEWVCPNCGRALYWEWR